MSDIDTMNGLMATAAGTPDPLTNATTNIWNIPATRVNKTKLTIQIDQNSAFWTIYPATTAYPVLRGQSSPDLRLALQRLGVLL